MKNKRSKRDTYEGTSGADIGNFNMTWVQRSAERFERGNTENTNTVRAATTAERRSCSGRPCYVIRYVCFVSLSLSVENSGTRNPGSQLGEQRYAREATVIEKITCARC